MTSGCGCPHPATTRLVYTSTGEEWHICSFNAQPEAPAFFAAGPGQAGASGWALNESFSTGSGIDGPITNGPSPLGQDHANWIRPYKDFPRGAGHWRTALVFASPNPGNPQKLPRRNSALFLKLQFAKLFKFAAQTVP